MKHTNTQNMKNQNNDHNDHNDETASPCPTVAPALAAGHGSCKATRSGLRCPAPKPPRRKSDFCPHKPEGRARRKALAGAVRIHKRVRCNKVWQREPFTYGQAWIDLLLLAVDASSAPQEVWSRGEQITLQLGQVGWSVAALAAEWQRSREWVMGFLKWCQQERMIAQKSDGRGTVITILNYEAYQSDTAAPARKKAGGKPLQPEIPADEVLAQFFAEFRDVARGVEGIPEVWWRGWVASRLNARKWPEDWQRAAAMAFLADVQAGHPKALAWTGAGLKNRAGYERDVRVSGLTPAQRRFELSRELEEVKARLDACHQSSIQPEAADVRREKELEKAMKELNAEVNCD